MAGCGQCIKVEPDCDVMDGIVKKEVKEDMQSVKEEPVCDDSADTSEAAVGELYADHEVKDELVLGIERKYRPGIGLAVRGMVKKDEDMQSVKEEPVCDDSADTSEAALGELYADHEVKDELVLGIERQYRPGIGLAVRGLVKKDEEIQSVKEEPVHDDSADTSEAALGELYADHVVKDELVLGPERPHRPDVGLAAMETSKSRNKTREEILEAKRRASRIRHEKIKKDSKLSALRKEQQKENYAKRKKEKRVVSIKDKSINEQQKQREKWRENSSAYYYKKSRLRKYSK